jgi:phosphoglycolate phosphatase
VTRRLILWDIDGTLMRTGGHGSRALEAAAAMVAGLAQVPSVDMHGKTDPQILREILIAAALADDEVDRLLPDVMSAAEAQLAEAGDAIRRDGALHAGVRNLVERLDATPGVRQSLVTGNLAANAAVKISAFGLEGFFDFEVGAFGTDHIDRNELVPIALDRVKELRGESYEPNEVWVIGDTDRDLECARVAHARCLLVGTGAPGPDGIRHLDADAIVDDLGDTDSVLQTLLS